MIRQETALRIFVILLRPEELHTYSQIAIGIHLLPTGYQAFYALGEKLCHRRDLSRSQSGRVLSEDPV